MGSLLDRALVDDPARSEPPRPAFPLAPARALPGGYVRWTTPSGRRYVTEPTRYPV